ncbi:hypothetical protein [Thermus antranikianii]|uniref:hypothetical protein n=1 Tax=Thermus antranikianii TaxID=88190 RepID=UPI001C77B122|nr:hypothetical protein [Thermus antranikianii]QWK23107.1 MAG: hypothetical protein KNN15_06680 [Thermus antranikianii]
METDPEKAEAVIRARELLRGMHMWARDLGRRVEAETKVDPAEVKRRAELVKAFLKASEEAKALEAALRRFNRDTEEAASKIQNRDPAAFRVEIEPSRTRSFWHASGRTWRRRPAWSSPRAF